MFSYTLMKHGFFDQSERVQGPIYIVITNAPFSLFALLHLS